MSEHIAGRELDALIAEKVMGWKFLPLPETNQHGLCDWCGRAFENDPRQRGKERGFCHDDCNFSDEMNSAWLVVGRIQQKDTSTIAGVKEVLEWKFLTLKNEGDKHWEATFDDYNPKMTVCAETAPLSICLAALKAMGVE